MKKEQVDSWREIRKKGVLRFVLVNALLGWGLPIFVALAFIIKPFSEGFLSRAAVVHYISWIVAGIVYGVTVWWLSERRYKRVLSNETAT